MSEIKTCKKCGATKFVEMFHLRAGVRKDGTRGRHSHCKVCMNLAKSEWNKKNPDKVNAKRKRHYAKNATRIANRNREWQRKNRFAMSLTWSRSDAKRRGYSPCTATVGELEEKFTGCCAFCGKREEECRGGLVMDHDHATGAFRGWLCSSCNKIDALAGVA